MMRYGLASPRWSPRRDPATAVSALRDALIRPIRGEPGHADRVAAGTLGDGLSANA